MLSDNFKNIEFYQKIFQSIKNKVKTNISIMEVCGTHTMAIFKGGIRDLLSDRITLISGPGCPICVTDQSFIDTAIQLSKKDNVIITTFGDIVKVPGTYSSLSHQKALGRDIRVVTSPLKSLLIAKQNPNKEVVFIGLGFETTAPIIALSVYNAKKNNIKNYSVLQSLKTMPGAIKKIMSDKNVNIDGLICPGHVSTIIGVKPFKFLSESLNLPMVIAGFEYCDIAVAIYYLIEMINYKKPNILNTYSRTVNYEGNLKAIKMIYTVFTPSFSKWRGLGKIENTGLTFKDEYKSYDAKFKFKLDTENSLIPKDCICGKILKGIKNPTQCKLFSKVCTPARPIGPCMVSQEGTCSVYYKYAVKKEKE